MRKSENSYATHIGLLQVYVDSVDVTLLQ